MSYQTPYTDSMSFSGPRITWAVQRIIFLCIIVFAVQLLIRPLEVLLFANFSISNAFSFHPGLFLQGHLWRAFTYQFMHDGLLHLFLNMLWLFFFGSDVERVLGTRGFFRFYLTCATVGVLATLLPYVLNQSDPYIVGASGGVMGVLVAFAMIDPQRQFYLFPFPWPITAVALVVIVIVMNVVSALQNNPVSVATHFGGMGVGFLYMKLLPQVNAWQRSRRRVTKKPGKKTGNKTGGDMDKLGEEIDNIFKFKDRR